MSGRLVAAMMKTDPFEPTPSTSVRIWLTMRSPASPPPDCDEPRGFAIESISSKKRMHGAAARALRCVWLRRDRVGLSWGMMLGVWMMRAERRGAMRAHVRVESPSLSHRPTLSKRSRTLASDSPNHMVRSSGPLIETKFAEHSVATALAIRVLPHPGGP